MTDKIHVMRETDPHPLSFKEPKGYSADINLNRTEDELIFDEHDKNMDDIYSPLPPRHSKERSPSRSPSRVSSRSSDDASVSSRSTSSKGYENKSRERRAKKAYLLWKFKKLNKNNEYSPLVLDMNSSLRQIDDEVFRIEKEIDINSGSAFIRNIYITGISGLEFGSTQQKLLNLNLNGWSRKIKLDIDGDPKYNEYFNEIYEQYFKEYKMNPILGLTMATVFSGFSVHMANQSCNLNSFNSPKKEMSEPDTDLESIIGRMSGNDSDTSSVSDIDNISVASSIIEEPVITPKKRGRPKKVN